MNLEGYVKHAKRHGTDLVFETAKEEGLGLQDLFKLALALQGFNRRWRMPRQDAHSMVCCLAFKLSDEQLAKMAGVTVPTVQKWMLNEIEYEVPEG
jgi:hypothetical protein